MIRLIGAVLVIFSVALHAAEPWHAVAPPDQSDWSAKRISSYTRVLETRDKAIVPMAVLHVPSLEIEAPVFDDAIPGALEGGASWVSTTAMPDETGNIAIAGHRDSYFRRLEGVPVGTRMQLETAAGKQHFEVEKVSIVDPLDLSPLAETDDQVLTLITCYPFYFKGYAPDRYIVRAKRIKQISSVELADSAD